MFLKKLLIVCLLSLPIFNVNADDVAALTLSWEPPQADVNGRQIHAAKDVSEYRLYYGTSLDDVRSHSYVVSPKKNSLLLSRLNLQRLNSPIIYIGMTAVSLNGLESDLSELVFYLP